MGHTVSFCNTYRYADIFIGYLKKSYKYTYSESTPTLPFLSDYSMHGEVTDLQMYSGLLNTKQIVALTGRDCHCWIVFYTLLNSLLTTQKKFKFFEYFKISNGNA